MMKRMLEYHMNNQHYIGSLNPFDIVDEVSEMLGEHIDDMEDNAQQYHNDYLTKPFVINNLIDKLGHWLNIEWIKHDDESHVQSTIENAQNKPLVGKNQYQALKSIAEIGYLSGFSAKLEDISDHYYMPMETQKTLKQLASQIQFAKVVEKLDEHINRL